MTKAKGPVPLKYIASLVKINIIPQRLAVMRMRA